MREILSFTVQSSRKIACISNDVKRFLKTIQDPLTCLKAGSTFFSVKCFPSLCVVPIFCFSQLYAGLKTELVLKGLDRPVWAGAPDSVKGKLWVMEQAGTVWIVDLTTGQKHSEPFLKINERVERNGNEQGLLGLAFAPDYNRSGTYFVNYTGKDKHSYVERFSSKDGKTTDPNSGEITLKYRQDFDNHNGGWLDFGPDGMLWITTGDGGSGNDPHDRAQDLTQYLGKILRLDVSGSKGYKIPQDNGFAKVKDALPEIHAIGLRNPWRCSFDRVRGDFWIGDVGQNHQEEINALPLDRVGGSNFGWRMREGEMKTPSNGVGGSKPKDNIEPVYVYGHGCGPSEGLSVTGGFVYRGGKVKSLLGRYIFADYQNARIWSFALIGGKASDFQDHTSELQPEGGRINLISSFGEDAEGEIYLVDLSGAVYRITAR